MSQNGEEEMDVAPIEQQEEQEDHLEAEEEGNRMHEDPGAADEGDQEREEYGQQQFEDTDNQGEDEGDSQQQYQEFDPQNDPYGAEYGQEEGLEMEQEDDMARDQRQNEIMEEIYRITQQVQETGQKWCDSEFPADDKSLYLDPLQPPEYAQDMPAVEWRRPEEIWTNQAEGQRAVMMKDYARPGDVKPGILNDMWLLGTFSAMGLNPELLRNLIIHDGLEYGFAVFQFFKNGFWQHVKVDTRIPYNNTTKTPLYGHCADSQEFWLPLIEKAYAKLHGSYEILNAGQICEALVDMTGGVAEMYDLTKAENKALLDNGQFWKDIRKQHQQGYLVVCEHVEVDEVGNPFEGQGIKGIAFNKAYGVWRMAEFTDYSQPLQLLYMRNPWGPSQSSVWVGAFSDEEESWDDYKGLRDRLEYQFKSDGNFWMRFEDWKANYNRIYLCKIFPSTWTQFSVASEWKGNTAGGAYPNLHADQKPVTEEQKDANAIPVLDTCDRWFNNPQFRLSVTKRTQVIISLMQEDQKISKRQLIPSNYLVVRVKSKRDRLWEINSDDIVLEAAPEGSQQTDIQRELTRTLWLTPQHDKKDVHYIIVPNTELEGRGKEEERPFYLRVFASEQIELVELPQTIETTFTNGWRQNSSGGKLGCPMWCRNPQYFLNITKPTHLKIILRKKGQKRNRAGPLGFTITKANAPTVPPESTIIGKGKKGMSMPSSLVINGRTYAETLATTTFKKEKGSDAIPEFELPRLPQKLERKLQILDGEQRWTTSYNSEDTAAMYQFFKPTEGPFVIVPSLLKDDKQQEFTLTVFSSNPIQMQPLQENTNVVLTSRWTDKNCGGSHLYDKEFMSNPDHQTWINNPKFILKLDCSGPTEVKITLSRPEGPWKKPVGKNLVGCMIGFYVHENNPAEPPNKENVLNKEGTKFVPWNEVSETLMLEGSQDSRFKDGYVIMPCTYESSKDIQGPFMLAVSSSVEFEVKQLE